MSRFIKATVFCLVIVFSVISFSILKADVGEPGSQSDPIVTKSYIDEVIANLKQYIDSHSNTKGSNNFELVYLTTGEKLIAGAGTEIILRSGQATAIVGDLGGLSDITAGKDLAKDENVPLNHLLIVPRDDNRGIYSKRDNTIALVKGVYEVSKN